MIPDIRKILYTTDLSESARHAFSYAATLANRFDAKITILHVVEEFSANVQGQVAAFLGEEGWQGVQKRKEKEFMDTLRGRLDEFCDEMGSQLEACPFLVDEIIVKQGSPVEQILLQADESNCDVIVMGTHGHGLLADALIGSNARRVVRRCKKPVLVVRLPEEGT